MPRRVTRPNQVTPQPFTVRNAYYVINNDLYIHGRSNSCHSCDLANTRANQRRNLELSCPLTNIPDDLIVAFSCHRHNFKRVLRITPKQYTQLAAWTLSDYNPATLKHIKRMLKRVQNGILPPEGV